MDAVKIAPKRVIIKWAYTHMRKLRLATTIRVTINQLARQATLHRNLHWRLVRHISSHIMACCFNKRHKHYLTSTPNVTQQKQQYSLPNQPAATIYLHDRIRNLNHVPGKGVHNQFKVELYNATNTTIQITQNPTSLERVTLLLE